jgi:hypothetical protein
MNRTDRLPLRLRCAWRHRELGGGSGRLGEYFGLGPEIDDLEPERIPAADLGVR